MNRTTVPVIREERAIDALDAPGGRGEAGEADAWLDRPGFYSSRRWTRSQEGDRGFDTRYLACHGGPGGELRALVPFHRLAGGDSNPLYNETTVLADNPGVQVLAGSRTGYDNRILLHPGCSPAERADLLTAVTAHLLDRAREAGADHVSWWYLPAAEAEELAALTGFATASTPCLPSAVIPLSPGGFEDHLAGLPAARRALVRRDLRRVASGGYTAHTAPADPATVEQYAPLVCQVQRRHGEDLSEEGAVRYLRRCLGSGLGPDAVITEVLAADGALAAFSLGIRHGRALYMRVFGCDYAGGHGASGEYFEATLHGPARYALALGLSELHLGVTSYRAKSLRGARLLNRRVVLVAASPDRLPALAPDWGFLGDDARFLTRPALEAVPC
ncbi:GNAT family N-acetyltransferase [Kitasatospora sp. NPDC101183]|uniref:GNAT family N-acetyltransferase n=1 Tax=Kitasatospora sp. NPDC101183 TaxID=3364100 RepID=UPI0037F64588